MAELKVTLVKSRIGTKNSSPSCEGVNPMSARTRMPWIRSARAGSSVMH